jgi:hypothetical protein
MAEGGGEPTDRPQASGTERQQGVTPVPELRTMKSALKPTPLADEYTFD